jgi:hypothetical protein
MWIVAIAWMYVALMMSMAEATSPQGTVIGAIITFLFYGLAPVALVMYVLRTPMRRKALQQMQAEEQQAHLADTAADAAHPGSPDEDGGGLPSGDAIAPEREKP